MLSKAREDLCLSDTRRTIGQQFEASLRCDSCRGCLSFYAQVGAEPNLRQRELLDVITTSEFLNCRLCQYPGAPGLSAGISHRRCIEEQAGSIELCWPLLGGHLFPQLECDLEVIGRFRGRPN